MNAKITRTINRIGLQIKKHSPEIMMVAGVVGTVVGAVMACKATTKIDDILNETKNNVDKIHAAEEKGQITTDKDGELIIEEYTADDCKKDLSITYAKTGLELAKNASNIPNNAPQITSDGKCTYRYSLVKHIKAARIIAGIPNFLLYSKITVAAENEDIA